MTGPPLRGQTGDEGERRKRRRTSRMVVVKTRTEYQTEKKRLKVPKMEEFTISFTDGVSERLKVRGGEREGGGDEERKRLVLG
ncbi:Neuron-specific protein family member 1 [Liparis tanakae]|uniref:Neuron-specific protein family member 1 n=1 Tax=Liparis tanakae TaxID=230148 RepID=A0A4Z2EEH6_9TELE|nr:Neuron-specific protein family member 1 [Liparis tanakae]